MLMFEELKDIVRYERRKQVVVRVRDRAALASGDVVSLKSEGMFIRSGNPLEIGTQVSFELIVDDEKLRVKGAGIVTYVARTVGGALAGFGVQFLRASSLLQALAGGLPRQITRSSRTLEITSAVLDQVRLAV